jgi:hypothetical protein
MHIAMTGMNASRLVIAVEVFSGTVFPIIRKLTAIEYRVISMVYAAKTFRIFFILSIFGDHLVVVFTVFPFLLCRQVFFV